MKQKITSCTVEFFVICIVFAGGCQHTEPVSMELPTAVKSDSPETTAFLARFDKLFNSDIADQSGEYKDATRRFILIHARDLLKQVGEDEKSFDKIVIERLAIRQGRGEPFQMSYNYAVPDEKSASLPEDQLLYRWSIGIKHDDQEMYAPFYTLLGAYMGKIAVCRIIFEYSACGGLFSDCCSQSRPPKYLTDDDGTTAKEVTEALDAISTRQGVTFYLAVGDINRDPEFVGPQSFKIAPGGKLSEASFNYLERAHAYFSTKQ